MRFVYMLLLISIVGCAEKDKNDELYLASFAGEKWKSWGGHEMAVEHFGYVGATQMFFYKHPSMANHCTCNVDFAGSVDSGVATISGCIESAAFMRTGECDLLETNYDYTRIDSMTLSVCLSGDCREFIRR